MQRRCDTILWAREGRRRAILGTDRCGSLVSALGEGNDTVVITATVIAFLERDYSARESEWCAVSSQLVNARQ